MSIKEQIAYLRGLIEGADYFAKDDKGKDIWNNLLQICSGLANKVEFLEQDNQELAEYIEAVDMDLADVEEVLFESDEDVELICPECGANVDCEELDDCTCPECGGSLCDEEDYDEDYQADDESEDVKGRLSNRD
jgi:hypothetical protein